MTLDDPENGLGLPVRTGVEGTTSRSSCICVRSPCANRGRRDAPDFSLHPCRVSLCEQGSKDCRYQSWANENGLPVRTGVEEWEVEVSGEVIGSPCANRGRRDSSAVSALTIAVSLCEQGSKAELACEWITECGLPVRTGVEGKGKSVSKNIWGSPCANRVEG